MDTSAQKKQIRREIISRRRELLPDELKVRSLAVLRSLWASGLIPRRGTAALYAAAGGEVLTEPLFHQLRDEGLRVVLPRVRGKGPELDFYPVEDWKMLEPSRLAIPEPRPEGPAVDPAEFDLVLVPGVAFDRAGGRLGYGMGCYDRVLARTRPDAPRVGVGFDFQLLEKVPMEAHDVPLTAIMTESDIVLVQPGGPLA